MPAVHPGVRAVLLLSILLLTATLPAASSAVHAREGEIPPGKLQAADPGAPAPLTPTDETALRRLAADYYAAWPREDLEGLFRFWSARAPELDERHREMGRLFAANDAIQTGQIGVTLIGRQGDQASLKVEFEMTAVEAKSGKPATGFGRLTRSLRCVSEEGAWRVWHEASAETDLAAELAALDSDEERETRLAASEDLATVELRRRLIDQGNRVGSRGDPNRAMALYRLAERLAGRIKDEAGVAVALNRIGVLLRYQGRYDEAMENHDRSLEIFQRLDIKEGIAMVLNSMANIHNVQGDFDKAAGIYERCLALSEETGEQDGIASALNNLGSVEARRGNYSAALDYGRRSLAIAEEIDDRTSIAFTLTLIGQIQTQEGRFDEALETLTRSLAISELLQDRSGMARTLNARATVHLGQADYRRALESYQQSLDLAQGLGETLAIAYALHNIGLVQRNQGNLDLALDYFQKSLAVVRELKDRHGLCVSLNSLGGLLTRRGDFGAALERFQEALGIAEEVGDRPQAASALRNLGGLRRLRGEPAAAREALEKSLALAETLGERQMVARALADLAYLDAAQGDHERASDSAARAASIAREIGDRNLLQEALALQGRSLRVLGRTFGARQVLEEAAGTIESWRADVAGDEQDEERFFEDKLSPYHEMVRLAAAGDRPEEALAWAERSRARALLEVLRSGRSRIRGAMTAAEKDRERALSDTLISINAQVRRERRGPAVDRGRLSALEDRQRQARLDYEAFRATLYAGHPGLQGRRGEAEPPTLAEAAALLPGEDAAILEYVVTDDATYLLVLSGKERPRLVIRPIAVRRKDLEDRARGFRERLARRDLGYREEAAALYDLLLRPAGKDLAGMTRLLIVPDGTLWELPFQALMPGPGRHLAEQAAIVYAPSLAALREMVRASRGPVEDPTLLALGNPVAGPGPADPDRSAPVDAGLSPLPSAEREVRAIARLYGASRSRVLTGAAASEERFKTEAGHYRIVHLATHGLLDDRSPIYSQLLLARPVDGSQEDGLLEAREILDLDLRADVVVLSACETARGRLGAGEGVIGLSWALFVAGAPATVVSQWKVDAASTTDLMVGLHRGLRSGRSAGEALRDSALRLSRDARYRHPFYWAGFVVVGAGF